MGHEDTSVETTFLSLFVQYKIPTALIGTFFHTSSQH